MSAHDPDCYCPGCTAGLNPDPIPPRLCGHSSGDVLVCRECFYELKDRAESAEARATRAEEQIAALRAALQWCGGSQDFAPGGVAREGWMRMCVPLLGELSQAVEAIAEESRTKEPT